MLGSDDATSVPKITVPSISTVTDAFACFAMRPVSIFTVWEPNLNSFVCIIFLVLVL